MSEQKFEIHCCGCGKTETVETYQEAKYHGWKVNRYDHHRIYAGAHCDECWHGPTGDQFRSYEADEPIESDDEFFDPEIVNGRDCDGVGAGYSGW